MGLVTTILEQIDAGDPSAASRLLPVVYDDLRRAAAAMLAQETSGNTLQPTALVHEAYLRLVEGGTPQKWNHRGHFFAAAAEAMRRILVEAARRKKRDKHGGRLQRIPLHDSTAASDAPAFDLLALDESLTRLAARHPDIARLVTLRYFAGLTMDDAAEMMGVSARSAARDWAYARAWLLDDLSDGNGV